MPTGPISDSGELRLFVALWPGARVRAAIEHRRAGWTWPPGTTPVAPARLHLTLHFIGAFPAARLPALQQALRLPCPRFELGFGAGEVWRGGIAVLRPRTVPAAIAALHAEVGDALRGIGLGVETRAFRPHVTLARHADGARPPADELSVAWPVRDFVLVASRAGAYQRLALPR